MPECKIIFNSILDSFPFTTSIYEDMVNEVNSSDLVYQVKNTQYPIEVRDGLPYHGDWLVEGKGEWVSPQPEVEILEEPEEEEISLIAFKSGRKTAGQSTEGNLILNDYSSATKEKIMQNLSSKHTLVAMEDSADYYPEGQVPDTIDGVILVVVENFTGNETKTEILNKVPKFAKWNGRPYPITMEYDIEDKTLEESSFGNRDHEDKGENKGRITLRAELEFEGDIDKARKAFEDEFNQIQEVRRKIKEGLPYVAFPIEEVSKGVGLFGKHEPLSEEFKDKIIGVSVEGGIPHFHFREDLGELTEYERIQRTNVPLRTYAFNKKEVDFIMDNMFTDGWFNKDFIPVLRLMFGNRPNQDDVLSIVQVGGKEEIHYRTKNGLFIIKEGQRVSEKNLKALRSNFNINLRRNFTYLFETFLQDDITKSIRDFYEFSNRKYTYDLQVLEDYLELIGLDPYDPLTDYLAKAFYPAYKPNNLEEHGETYLRVNRYAYLGEPKEYDNPIPQEVTLEIVEEAPEGYKEFKEVVDKRFEESGTKEIWVETKSVYNKKTNTVKLNKKQITKRPFIQTEERIHALITRWIDQNQTSDEFKALLKIAEDIKKRKKSKKSSKIWDDIFSKGEAEMVNEMIARGLTDPALIKELKEWKDETLYEKFTRVITKIINKILGREKNHYTELAKYFEFMSTYEPIETEEDFTIDDEALDLLNTYYDVDEFDDYNDKDIRDGLDYIFGVMFLAGKNKSVNFTSVANKFDKKSKVLFRRFVGVNRKHPALKGFLSNITDDDVVRWYDDPDSIFTFQESNEDEDLLSLEDENVDWTKEKGTSQPIQNRINTRLRDTFKILPKVDSEGNTIENPRTGIPEPNSLPVLLYDLYKDFGGNLNPEDVRNQLLASDRKDYKTLARLINIKNEPYNELALSFYSAVQLQFLPYLKVKKEEKLDKSGDIINRDKVFIDTGDNKKLIKSQWNSNFSEIKSNPRYFNQVNGRYVPTEFYLNQIEQIASDLSVAGVNDRVELIKELEEYTGVIFLDEALEIVKESNIKFGLKYALSKTEWFGGNREVTNFYSSIYASVTGFRTLLEEESKVSDVRKSLMATDSNGNKQALFSLSNSAFMIKETFNQFREQLRKNGNKISDDELMSVVQGIVKNIYDKKFPERLRKDLEKGKVKIEVYNIGEMREDKLNETTSDLPNKRYIEQQEILMKQFGTVEFMRTETGSSAWGYRLVDSMNRSIQEKATPYYLTGNEKLQVDKEFRKIFKGFYEAEISKLNSLRDKPKPFGEFANITSKEYKSLLRIKSVRELREHYKNGFINKVEFEEFINKLEGVQKVKERYKKQREEKEKIRQISEDEIISKSEELIDNIDLELERLVDLQIDLEDSGQDSSEVQAKIQQLTNQLEELGAKEEEEFEKLQSRFDSDIEDNLTQEEKQINLVGIREAELKSYFKNKVIIGGYKPLFIFNFLPLDVQRRIIEGEVIKYKELESFVDQEIKETITQAKEDYEKYGVKFTADSYSFIMNHKIHQTYSGLLFYGDGNWFGKFFKRAKGVVSTGTGSMVGDKVYSSIQPELSQVFNEDVANSPIAKVSLVNDTNDKYNDEKFKDFKENVEKSLKDYLTNFKVSEDKAKKVTELVNESIKTYKEEINTGDGQSWVSLDLTRVVLSQRDLWETQGLDTLYNYEVNFLQVLKYLKDTNQLEQARKFIVEGKYEKLIDFGIEQSQIDLLVDKPDSTISPMKWQYFGGVREYSNYNPNIFIKTSFAPVLPSEAFGTNFESNMFKMYENNIGIIASESAMKGAIAKDGPMSLNSMENATQHPFHIYLPFLKEQLQTNNKVKEENLLATQFRKLLFADTFNGEELSKDIGDLYQEFIETLKDISETSKEELFKDLTIKDGVVTDKDVIKEFLLKELSRRSYSLENERLKDFLRNSEKVNIEYTSVSKTLSDILAGSIKKKLTRIKLPGNTLILKSSYGIDDSLKFYEFKDGKVHKAEAKIAMQGTFKKLLRRKDVREKAGKDASEYQLIVALNKLLRDENWIKENEKLVTIFGYRIPTSGINLMDSYVIKEFLPKSAGSTIIIPKESVVKAGEDFDIDKKSFYFPSFNDRGELIQAPKSMKLEDREIELAKLQVEKLNRKPKKELREELENYIARLKDVEKVTGNFFGGLTEAMEEYAEVLEELEEAMGSEWETIKNRIYELNQERSLYYVRDKKLATKEQRDNWFRLSTLINEEYSKLGQHEELFKEERELKKDIIKLRKNEEIRKFLDDRKLLKDAKFKNINELQDYKEQDDRIYELKNYTKLQKAANTNKLIDISSRAILQPERFFQLVTPVSTDFLSQELARVNTPSNVAAHRNTNLSTSLDKRLEMVISGQKLTGFSATDAVALQLFLRQNFRMETTLKTNRGTFDIEFPYLDREPNEYWDLTDLFTEDGILKSEFFNEDVQATIDAASGSILAPVNISKDTLPVWQFLIGVVGHRIYEATRFINSPMIIDRQLKLGQGYNSYIANVKVLSEYSQKDEMFKRYLSYKDNKEDERKAGIQWSKINKDFKELNELFKEDVGIGLLEARERINQFNKLNSEQQKEQFEGISEIMSAYMSSDYKGHYITAAYDFYLFEIYRKLGNEYTSMKNVLNFDTTPDRSAVDAQERLRKLETIREKSVFPYDIIKGVIDNSPITPYFVSDLTKSIYQQFTPLQSNEHFVDAVLEVMDDELRIKTTPKKDSLKVRMSNDFKEYLIKRFLKVEGQTFSNYYASISKTIWDRLNEYMEEGSEMKKHFYLRDFNENYQLISMAFEVRLDGYKDSIEQELKEMKAEEPQLYKDLMVAAMAQSGFSFGIGAFTDVFPIQDVTDFIESGVKEAEKVLESDEGQREIDFFKASYLTNPDNKKFIYDYKGKLENKPKYLEFTAEDVIDGVIITKEKWTEDTPTDKDAVYIYPDTANIDSSRTGGGYRVVNQSENSIGLIIRKSYVFQDEREFTIDEKTGKKNYLFKEEYNQMFQDTNEDFELFKKLNRERLEEIGKYKNIVFPKRLSTSGISLPKKFNEWLGKELKSRFGVVTRLNKEESGLLMVEVVDNSVLNSYYELTEGVNSLDELTERVKNNPRPLNNYAVEKLGYLLAWGMGDISNKEADELADFLNGEDKPWTQLGTYPIHSSSLEKVLSGEKKYSVRDYDNSSQRTIHKGIKIDINRLGEFMTFSEMVDYLKTSPEQFIKDMGIETIETQQLQDFVNEILSQQEALTRLIEEIGGSKGSQYTIGSEKYDIPNGFIYDIGGKLKVLTDKGNFNSGYFIGTPNQLELSEDLINALSLKYPPKRSLMEYQVLNEIKNEAELETFYSLEDVLTESLTQCKL